MLATIAVQLQQIQRRFSDNLTDYLIDIQHDEDFAGDHFREECLELLRDLLSPNFKEVVQALTSGFRNGHYLMMLPETISSQMDLIENGNFVLVVTDARREGKALVAFTASQIA